MGGWLGLLVFSRGWSQKGGAVRSPFPSTFVCVSGGVS